MEILRLSASFAALFCTARSRSAKFVGAVGAWEEDGSPQRRRSWRKCRHQSCAASNASRFCTATSLVEKHRRGSG
eukprot:1497074-Rhodomonas_salina.1